MFFWLAWCDLRQDGVKRGFPSGFWLSRANRVRNFSDNEQHVLWKKILGQPQGSLKTGKGHGFPWPPHILILSTGGVRLAQ